jgi:twinkle protein
MNEAIKIPTHLKTLYGLFPLSVVPQAKSIADSVIESGWWELDQIFRAYPGQLVVTTGKAGHGKSTFLFNLIMNLCSRADKRAFLYVPENERHLRAKLRRIWSDNPQQFELLSQENLYIQCAGYEHYDSEPHTIDWVLEAAYGAIEYYGIDVVMIDPWNELERAKKKDQLLADYIGECLMKVKNFAHCTETTVFMVAHPTKAASERGVTLADIEGSMNWWNKCDNGLIVERDQTSTKVVSAKVREHGAGKIGACFFTVNGNERFIPQKGAVSL